MPRRSMRSTALASAWAPALGLALSIWAALPAGATSIPNLVVTPDAAVPWSIIGASGTVDPYDPGSEGALDFASDAICLDGACSDPNVFSNQDWLVFRVTVDSGSIDEVAFAALFETSLGVGYFANLGGQAPVSGDSTTVPNTPVVDFASLVGQSAPLFAVFAAGALPSAGGGPFGPGSTSFALTLGGASDQFLGSSNTVIPEPSTALLLGAGLLLFAGARHRRA